MSHCYTQIQHLGGKLLILKTFFLKCWKQVEGWWKQVESWWKQVEGSVEIKQVVGVLETGGGVGEN